MRRSRSDDGVIYRQPSGKRTADNSQPRGDKAETVDTVSTLRQVYLAPGKDEQLSADPVSGGKASILHALQRRLGNAQVRRILESGALQTKLIIGRPDDEFEREADREAEAFVTESTAHSLHWPVEEEESSAKRTKEESAETLRRKSETTSDTTGYDGNQTQIHSERKIKDEEGRGTALPEHLLATMESRFRQDLSGVRIHTDGESDKVTRELGAKAFAVGHDIFFRSGAFSPDREDGRRLLAHEIAHVVQQAGGRISRQAAEPGETERAAPAAQGIRAGLQEAVDKLRNRIEKEQVTTLLARIVACMNQDMPQSTYRWAVEQAAEATLDTLEKRLGPVDRTLAKDEVVSGLLELTTEAAGLGDDDKALEKAVKAALGRRETKLSTAITRLKQSPEEEMAYEVAIEAVQVHLLGREPVEAWQALRAWMEENDRQSRPAKGK